MMNDTQTGITVNLNQAVRFKPRPPAVDAWDSYFAQVGMAPRPLQFDADGYCSLQLWEFCHVFGPLMMIGMNPPVETDIIIEPLR